MSDKPVNLNRVRKDKARAAKKARADENSLKFGRSKAEISLDQARKSRAAQILDAHRRAPEGKSPDKSDAPSDEGERDP
ncbi:DUF4169 family protein [Roseovarius nubinhibens]|uniref:DUF4169 family protein n=1 Tax=Roseovarius nubinhibens TaxID=314263 RepID=UPI001C09F8EA|nr:DUF4169 family protein [Roseovarius nubinhibens]